MAHLKPASLRALRVLQRALGAAELRSFFADVRESADDDLLAPEQAAPADPTLTAVTTLLAPFPQTSAAKARLLAAHLEHLVGRKLPIRARGLTGAVRALRALLSEDDIRDGAFSLRVTLAQAQTSSAQTKDHSHES